MSLLKLYQHRLWSLWSDSIAFPWSTLIWFDLIWFDLIHAYRNTWTSDSMAVRTHKFIKCFGMYINFRLNGYVYSWMYFLLSLVCLVYYWNSDCVNCLYIRRVTLPLAKTPHKQDANFIFFGACSWLSTEEWLCVFINVLLWSIFVIAIYFV